MTTTIIRAIFFISTYIFGYTLFAQKSQIGIYLNPNIASTKLNGDYKPVFYALKQGSRFGFDAGIFYKYSILERLKVELRAGYSLKGFTYLELTDGQNNSLMYPKTKINISYQYLEIPIIISYSIIKKSWFEFYPAIGFINNFLLSKRSDIFYNYQKYYPGMQLGAGLVFYPSKGIAINIEPTEKTSLTPVAAYMLNSPLTRSLHSFGITIGLGVML